MMKKLPMTRGKVMNREARTAEVVSIREHLAAVPKAHRFFVERILEGCENHGIDLDSPWPPQFPDNETLPTASEEKKKVSAEIIQLPLFPPNHAGTPDCFLRSSVFAGTDRGSEYVELQPVKSVAGYDITFTGKQLTQHHLVVWEALVKLANMHPLGTECAFSIHSFLKKRLGYKGKIGKTDYEKICLTFTQLRACAIEVKSKDKVLVYGGGPIDEYKRNDDTGFAVIKLSPGLIKLFGKGMWSPVQWEQRLALKKYPLALWLHGFYSSHAKPFPYKVETLQELSGSNIKRLRRFREALKKALHRLMESGVITGWHIGSGDLVHVEKTPTASQARALIPALKKSS
jgi:hypothetical protein